MNYVKYSRNMVMLEDQGSEFTAKGGPVKGHLKVETGNNKGAMRVSVHNLKPYPKGDYIYKLIFFGKADERTIHAIVGNLILNRNGSGESYFRFNPTDLDGKGNDYSQFTTAIVAAVATDDDQEPLHPVLKGLTGNQPSLRRPQAARQEDRNQRPKETLDDKIARAASFMEPPAQDEPEPARERAQWEAPQNHEQKAMQNPETKTAWNAEAEAAHLERQMTPEEMLRIKREREPKESGEPMGRRRHSSVPANTPADASAKAPTENTAGRDSTSNGKDAPQAEQLENAAQTENGSQVKKKSHYNNFYNEYILHACNHACRSAEYYEEVAPFETDATRARWKKIMNVGNLPLVSPGAKYFAAQYHHYLFGAEADEKGYACRFYFAIPGRNLEGDKPDGGKSGFTCWQPVKGEENKENGYGYWITAVDAATGNIEDV